MKRALQSLVQAKSTAATLPLVIVHVNIVFYALNYWLCQPIMPFLAKELGADQVVFGWLSTFFSLVQLLGGPVIGWICDTKGPRLALQVSQAGTAVSYVLLGAASSIPLLFLSQLPTVTMHAMHASQAFCSQFSSASGRALALGRLSLSYGIGMVVGSSLGGQLSEFIGYSGVAYVAATLSVSMLVLNVMCLPVVKASESKETDTPSVWALMAQPKIASIIAYQVLLGVALSMYRTTFSMSVTRFGFDAKMLGYYQSAGAVLGVVTNTFLLGWFVDLLGGREDWLLRACSATLVVCFLTYAFIIETAEGIFLLLVPFSLATSCIYTVATSVLSKAASQDKAGTAIGLGHSARSFSGLVGPTIGGYVSAVQFEWVGMAAAAIAAVSAAMI